MGRHLVRWAVLAFACSTALLSAGVARALPVLDVLSVFDPSRNLFASVSLTEREALLDPARVVFIPTPGLADPAQFGNSTTVVGPGGTYLDVFGVADLGAGPVLAFNSFNPGSPFGAQSSIFLPLGDGNFDATMYLSPSFRDAGYTAEFVAVPSPASLPLVAIGAFAFWAVGRREGRRPR